MRRSGMTDRKKADELYRSSIKVLRSVQTKNGGCLATPKGKRYPYIYPRDNAVCVLGFLSAGLYVEAKKALNFIMKTQLDSGAFPQRVDVRGRDASYKPIQIDGTALTLYSLARYVLSSGDYGFWKRHADAVNRAMRYIEKNIYNEKGLVFTPNSVHEFPPMEEGLEIWANAACAAAAKQAHAVSLEAGTERREWLQLSKTIIKGIDKYMWNSRTGSFVKVIRLRESSSVDIDPDAGILGLVEFGVFDDSNDKILSSIRRIERELWNRELGGLCRYPKYEGRNNGGWGPWPHFTLMLCSHYIRLGERKKAERLLDWTLKVSRNNLLPEHISTKKEFLEYVHDFREAGILRKDRLVMIRNAMRNPMYKKGIAYISLPLAWPHAEFIKAWNLYNERFIER